MADDLIEIHQSLPAERSETGVVERGVGGAGSGIPVHREMEVNRDAGPRTDVL
ncbi:MULTISPECIES: hypothetical protein [Streptomyces]|uniref:Uncharacterized protein n=1 Tax=Streptomyces ortus TaxID=2867268 RepID=A0ABT3VEX6_9ACTN|nr:MULTISPECIES: hypothetical protein [Streptomyces]MCX4238418.1 hypothetical protein [Streptomyces ortus]